MKPAKATVTVCMSSALMLASASAALAVPAPPPEEWMFEGSVPADGATAVHRDQPLVTSSRGPSRTP